MWPLPWQNIKRTSATSSFIHLCNILAKFVDANCCGKKLHFDGYVYMKIQESIVSGDVKSIDKAMRQGQHQREVV